MQMPVTVPSLRRAGLLFLLWIVSHGVSASDKEPQEYLDEETAATITVVGKPLVFAYARRDLAANARDYVSLAAAAVNRAGKVSYVVIGYIWSTADAHRRPDPLPPADAVVLVADDRVMPLKLVGHSAHEAGIGVPVHQPAGFNLVPNVYSTDLASLRFVAAARQLHVHIELPDTTLSFELWEDRRDALGAFVRQLGGW
ncbi:MAG: hypothetical protein JSR36_09645 [Proteobacteria bacterium]|nr:hypothetical protein [Pseudomonadota bacterium]